MRCEKCGAEIGDARVCSFCDTPRRNVLVGDNVIQGFKTSNVMHAPINLMDKDINSGTTVLETYGWEEQMYVDGLKKSTICFVETDADSLDTYYYVDDNDEVVQFKSEDCFLNDEKEKTADSYVVSSSNMFAVYQISDSYEIPGDSYNRSEGEEIITINTYDLYLQKRDRLILFKYVILQHEIVKEG